MLFPVVAALIYAVMHKRNINTVPSAIVASVCATLLHTVLVLGLIYLTFHAQPTVGQNLVTFIIAWAGVNALIELVSAGLVSGVLVKPLSYALNRTAI